jgi:hypothetical protein
VPGGSGSLQTSAPIAPGAAGLPSASKTRTSQPGTALVGEPCLTGKGSMPMQFAAMAQPVSVCHQWSITGTLSFSSAQRSVSGSERSPARNSVRKRERSYLPISAPCGSSRLIARKAVGAVKSAATLCCAITRQKAPASGVPTGLPS